MDDLAIDRWGIWFQAETINRIIGIVFDLSV
jgi:hypothetical protein